MHILRGVIKFFVFFIVPVSGFAAEGDLSGANTAWILTSTEPMVLSSMLMLTTPKYTGL